MKEVFYKLYKHIWENTLICHIFSGIGIGGILAIVVVRNSIANQVVSKNTLNALTNTISDILIPLFIVFAFLLVNLLSYYFKENVEILNIFYMLGIKKSDQRFFLGNLFGSIFLVDLAVGIIFGKILLWISEFVLQRLSKYNFDFTITLLSIIIVFVVWAVLFLIVLALSYDSWLKRSYKSTTMERLPKRHNKMGIIISIVLISIFVYIYSNLVRFENKEILVVILLGAYLLVRFYTANSVNYKDTSEKISKVIKNNWRRGHSRTDTIFSSIVILIIICTVFVANLNISTVLTSGNIEESYPFDIVCYAYSEDQEKYEDIAERYELEMISFPMVRVSNMDTTDAIESKGETPIQGQQIGISESTYHDLKKYTNAQCKKEDLGLDAEGEKIYIVHQQEQSVRAQPIDYWLWSSRPLIHIGQPCLSMGYGKAVMAREWDIGYSFKTIIDEEIGSLIGIFDCTGKQENIIVFSNEYFEIAKEEWKTRNIYTGEPITEEEKEFVAELTKEGPSQLILLNGVNEKNRTLLMEELKEIESLHSDDFTYNKIVRNLYDKESAMSDMVGMQAMKLSIGFLQILLFVVMMVEVLLVEIITFKDEFKKRDTLLDCLGMEKKQRDSLMKRDLLRTIHTGEIVAIIISIGLYVAVFKARMFEMEVIRANCVYVFLVGLLTLLIIECLLQVAVRTWIHMYERRSR